MEVTMGGVFVSKRATAKRRQVQKTQTPASTGTIVPYSLDGSYAWIDSQTTTSYRSRGRRGDDEVVPTSSAEFIYLQQQAGELKQPSYDIGHEFSTIKYTRDGGFNDGKNADIYYYEGAFSFMRRVSHLRTGNTYKHAGIDRQV
jgi:hypothetical protein